jgi:transposase
LALPGFGPIVSAAFLSQVGSGKQFSNGRQLSAWCGLVPRQFSSGGKTKLGKITKNGNNELRALLIHGARSVSKYTPERTDALSLRLNKISSISARGALWPSHNALQSSVQDKLCLTSAALIKKGI